MSSLLQNIPQWVANASATSTTRFRRAVHIILHAIAGEPRLRELLCMKGGILLALHYNSPRHTSDIDFSTPKPFDETLEHEIKELLAQRLAASPEELGYDLACHLQSLRVMPRRDKTYITIKIKIGYAVIGSKEHRQMLSGSPIRETVGIDYSFRETIPDIESVHISEEETICVYGLSTLVAEKFRSLLQQKIRDRTRRQDAWDIDYLLRTRPELLSEKYKAAALADLRIKCADREIAVTQEMIDDPDLRERSAADYDSLAAELSEGELPEFGPMFDRVLEYWHSLPWVETSSHDEATLNMPQIADANTPS
jgi:predicted nucleotidyltransferase component of viral defense system